MIGGEDPGDGDVHGDSPLDPHGTPSGPHDRGSTAPDPSRQWRHPSEVGLATRGRQDRRRSTLIAAGVLLGGLGLLASGLFLGSIPERSASPGSTTPLQRLETSVAAVMAVDDDGSTTTATAVVLDDGHLVVDGATLGGAATMWAQCADGSVEQVEVVGSDAGTGLWVLQVGKSPGTPAIAASTPPPVDSDLVVVRADPTMTTVPAAAGTAQVGTQLIGATSSRTPRHFAAHLTATPLDAGTGQSAGDREIADTADTAGTADDIDGAAVFDRAGHLTGVVVGSQDDSGTGSSGQVAVLDAADVMRVARTLIDQR